MTQSAAPSSASGNAYDRSTEMHVTSRLSASAPGDTVRHQLARYAIAGSGVYLSDLVAYCLAILVDPGHYLVANCAGRLTGALVGFIVHRRWTFGGPQKLGWPSQLLVYLVLLGTNVLTSSFLLWLLVAGFGLAKLPSRMSVDVLILGSTFLVSRHLVFGTRQR